MRCGGPRPFCWRLPLRALAFGIAAVLLLVACASAAPPTPIIVYVTPPASEPTAVATTPVESAPPTPTITASPKASITPTPEPTRWYPKGYTAMEDFSTITGIPPLAFRWLKKPDCSPGARCLGMYIIFRDGCPSHMSVELSLTDRDGVAIDYAIDSVGSLDAGQKAKLIFNSYEDDARSGELANVTCY